MTQRELDGLTAFVTGSGRGLGQVMATRLAELGADMKKTIDAELGDVHVLVNCAGGDIGAAGTKPSPNNALDISYEDIRVLIDNNLIGTMLVCQAFVPPMKARGSGSVINIASAAAHIGCSPEAVYSTLKAAVVQYTLCLAKEL